MSNHVILTVEAKAFSAEGVRQHRVAVDGETVRVYDPVAGHYTACHSLSAGAQRRIVRLARAHASVQPGDCVEA